MSNKISSQLSDNAGWNCIFSAATLNALPDQLPKNPALFGSTLRQQFQAAVGGEKIRLTFSNEYGEGLTPPDSDMVLESVHIAKLLKAGEPNIDLPTDTAITFGGRERVVIPAGGTVTSDGVDFSFESLDFLAVSVNFGELPPSPACHQEADCSCWIVGGNKVSENFSPSEHKWSYFALCRADALTSGVETFVCFGDSITDGSISTFNGFDAWPNLLAQGLQADPKTKHVSVVNSSIAGNAIWGGCGVPAKDRFKRDVLDIAGVKRVLLLIGTNDIPGAERDTSADMIREYSAMISACHAEGIKIYAGTVTPFGNNEHWRSELHESIRSKINDWMMSPESGFDGFVDFASAVCDPADPTVLSADCDSGDGLHPSVIGHREMGKAAVEKVKKLLA